MIRDSVHALFRRKPGDEDTAPSDEQAFFWLDFREDDDQVPGLCEAVLKTGQLSAGWDDEQLVIVWRNQRTPVPLKKSLAATLASSPVTAGITAALPSPLGDVLPWLTRENRHITLVTLNRVLQPDYEIRHVRDADDDDDGEVYLPLSAEDWKTLEAQYGRAAVDGVVEPIREAKETM